MIGRSVESLWVRGQGGIWCVGGVCHGKHDGHPPHLSILAAETASSAIAQVCLGFLKGSRRLFGDGRTMAALPSSNRVLTVFGGGAYYSGLAPHILTTGILVYTLAWCLTFTPAAPHPAPHPCPPPILPSSSPLSPPPYFPAPHLCPPPNTSQLICFPPSPCSFFHTR